MNLDIHCFFIPANKIENNVMGQGSYMMIV